jgi:hypothetical protein
VGEGLVAILAGFGILAAASGVVIWRLVKSKEAGAKAQQKLSDLSEVSKRESDSQDRLTERRMGLRDIVARWLRGDTDPDR